ncbi:MAG TPA: NAD(P)-dependent oxidoreductase [Xanthobacteraceae bacterium]|jgi:3-hydroxyisobutyrate dehydrogenase-like beta-hydroxyacid dehydrogenase|nr:NAD(P)-dependent oxidoreductase [Xanthobacteraceae bacterium]
MSERLQVGVIGIGLLGQAFVHRLRGAGFEVVGFDVDPAKTTKLADLGGHTALSVADLARRCDPIVLAVFSTDQVEAVVESELLPALGEGSGKIVLCASTCDPERIAALGQRVATRGLRLLETPVSGASGQVSRGEGVGLIGGDPHVVAAVEPVLRAMFPTYFHIGEIGDGGRAKLAVNLILGLNRLAVAEGLVFAERLGLDPEAFLKVARSSAAYSQVMDIKGAKMIRGEFAAEGRISQHLKDVHLMLEQAERVKQQLPLLEIHADVLEACVRHGEADLDNSAVIKEIRRRTRP